MVTPVKAIRVGVGLSKPNSDPPWTKRFTKFPRLTRSISRIRLFSGSLNCNSWISESPIIRPMMPKRLITVLEILARYSTTSWRRNKVVTSDQCNRIFFKKITISSQKIMDKGLFGHRTRIKIVLKSVFPTINYSHFVTFN